MASLYAVRWDIENLFSGNKERESTGTTEI